MNEANESVEMSAKKRFASRQSETLDSEFGGDRGNCGYLFIGKYRVARHRWWSAVRKAIPAPHLAPIGHGDAQCFLGTSI